MPKPPQIQPLGHDLSLFIRVMVHSEPGVGKTSLAGTAPKCLMLLADPNYQSAILRGAKSDKWEVKDWGDMDDALLYLANGGTDDYDWVFYDSMTHGQERTLDGIMLELQKTKGRKLWQRDQGDIGQNMNRLGMWCRDMIRLPINFGVTAHTMRDEIELDDGSIENLWVPAIQGRGMPARICSYMNLVGFMYSRRNSAGKIEVGTIFEKDSSHYAKDNWDGALGGHMMNATVPRIEAAINVKRRQLVAGGAAKVAGAASKAAPAKATVTKAVAGKKAVPAKAAAKKAGAATKKTTR